MIEIPCPQCDFPGPCWYIDTDSEMDILECPECHAEFRADLDGLGL
jgi:hypothetical protein